MPYVMVDTENGADVDLYYEDHGVGQPVLLVHGYPLNGRSWERQERALLGAGYRVITYDRRGFGMGTGEVTRYLSTYGSARIAKAVLVGALPPFLLWTTDNPEGVDGQVFEAIKAAIVRDRYAFFGDFLDDFFNIDAFSPDRISDRVWEAAFQVAAVSSPVAAHACIDAWLTDFRADLCRIDVPTLQILLDFLAR